MRVMSGCWIQVKDDYAVSGLCTPGAVQLAGTDIRVAKETLCESSRRKFGEIDG
jgi:hypothetical protein